MPHRFFNSAMETVMIALWTVMIAAADSLSKFGTEVIYDKMQFRVACFIGASVGALVNTLAVPPSEKNKGNGVRPMSAKWLVSWGCGMILTPIILRYFQLPADVDMCVGVSGALAIGGVSGVYWIFRIVTRHISGASQTTTKTENQ